MYFATRYCHTLPTLTFHWFLKVKGDDSANTDTFLLQGLPFVQFTLNKGLRSRETISLLECLVNLRIRVLIYAPINVNLFGGKAGKGWGFVREIQNDHNFCSLVKSPPLTHTLPSLWFTSLGALHINFESSKVSNQLKVFTFYKLKKAWKSPLE